MKLNNTILAATVTAALVSPAQAGEVEVLHYWTSGGEARSVAVLKDMVEDAGHLWTDFSVAGGGGENASTVLRSRAVSGNPPAAAQIKSPEMREWGELGFLASLDGVAQANDWDVLLPEVVADAMKYDNQYVAAPVNVHRVNWMWANSAVFEEAGVAIPTTLDELWQASEQLLAAGVIPIAHGGQDWQETMFFENIVLALGGPALFNKAFVEHDMDTLTGDTMKRSFVEFRKLNSYIDKGASGRAWNMATGMVIRGEAAMQIMGDWAKGEFSAAGMTPGTDYECLAFPGTQGDFIFNIDSLAMFKQSDPSRNEAQMAMAKLVLSTEFQETFNLNKGSIPARTDMDMSAFDSCALSSMDTFKAAAASGEGLVPALSVGMATSPTIQGAIYDTVTAFINNDVTADKAVIRLARAIRAVQ